jgi:hypothetical protein
MRLGVRRALLAAIALLTAASLTLLGWQWLGAAPVAAGTSASIGGMTTDVGQAGWINFDMAHVMDGQGGFMMPDAMMPGAPRGDDVRLGVPVTLSNTSSRTIEFNVLSEFTLTGGGLADPIKPVADTLGNLSRLGPGSALDGVLYFDLVPPEPDAPPLYLHWSRDGGRVQIAVPFSDDDVPQQHQQH